jgi:DNA gyrase inhibitor GyrI
LSNITVRNLRPCHLAFVRHLGPYAQVPQDLFNRLKSWADRRELPQPHIWLGLGHDAPSTTSPYPSGGGRLAWVGSERS